MEKLFLIFTVAYFCGILAQDCKTPGQQCESYKNCCGGCCKDNICINTYSSCEDVEYPCMNHSCPPGYECYMYQPECLGCAKAPNCRPAHEIENTNVKYSGTE